jgi:hypothetical protein
LRIVNNYDVATFEMLAERIFERYWFKKTYFVCTQMKCVPLQRIMKFFCNVDDVGPPDLTKAIASAAAHSVERG